MKYFWTKWETRKKGTWGVLIGFNYVPPNLPFAVRKYSETRSKRSETAGCFPTISFGIVENYKESSASFSETLKTDNPRMSFVFHLTIQLRREKKITECFPQVCRLQEEQTLYRRKFLTFKNFRSHVSYVAYIATF